MLGRNRITSLGVDEPGKAELDQDLLTATLVRHRRPGRGRPHRHHIERGAARRAPGRRFHDEITRDSPIRLSLQDCVIAWHAFRKARARGIGARIDLER
jgi:ornithine cyclodeaminase